MLGGGTLEELLKEANTHISKHLQNLELETLHPSLWVFRQVYLEPLVASLENPRYLVGIFGGEHVTQLAIRHMTMTIDN